jgi:NAD(P)H-dependent FMN reductase
MPRPVGEEPEGFRPLVAGLGGSTRPASRALEALEAALEGAARAGAQTMLLDVRELAVPILDAGRPESDHTGVQTLLTAVRSAHALIVASPVYHETVSGAVKNALDHLSVLEQEAPPGLAGKVVGLASVCGNEPSMGATLAVRSACRALGAWVLPDSVDLGGASFDVEGRLCDVLARDRVRTLGRRVALAAVARRAQDGVGPAAGAIVTRRTHP